MKKLNILAISISSLLALQLYAGEQEDPIEDQTVVEIEEAEEDNTTALNPNEDLRISFANKPF